MRLQYTILFILAALLASCSAQNDGAKLVAVYPGGESHPGSGSICTQTGYPGNSCHAYLMITTSNTARAAGQAKDLVERYDGYQVDKVDWSSRDGTGYTLVLAVPAEHMDALLRSLRRLGTVEHETVWSEWNEGYPHTWSRIVLDLQPRRNISLTLPKIHWNPAETFFSALQVSFVIFRTIVDVLIWVLVVIGPFILIWLGLRALLHRLRT